VATSRQTYSDVVSRLQAVVTELESGKLGLEQSLEKFEEGIRLVKSGEQLLSEAEARIDQLLTPDGHTAPLDSAPHAPPVKRPTAAVPPPPPSAPAPSEPEDDIPF
jgi:exodeoxyribonuclease VII small subunit